MNDSIQFFVIVFVNEVKGDMFVCCLGVLVEIFINEVYGIEFDGCYSYDLGFLLSVNGIIQEIEIIVSVNNEGNEFQCQFGW